jgi:hypothetical protein
VRAPREAAKVAYDHYAKAHDALWQELGEGYDQLPPETLAEMEAEEWSALLGDPADLDAFEPAMAEQEVEMDDFNRRSEAIARRLELLRARLAAPEPQPRTHVHARAQAPRPRSRRTRRRCHSPGRSGDDDDPAPEPKPDELAAAGGPEAGR